jgi:prepilin-type N-terminal cleavage/methylation domain-containing protein
MKTNAFFLDWGARPSRSRRPASRWVLLDLMFPARGRKRRARRPRSQEKSVDLTPTHQAAFTLIEIMMVVAILGLTLSLGIPSFVRSIKKEGMGKMERDLVQACQEARRAAIINKQTTDLVIRPLDRTFGVPGVFGPAEIPNDIVIDIMGVNFIQMEGAEEAHVHFQPNGTSDEFTIVLHASDGSYRKIYLDIVTALPRVETIR